CFLHQKTSAPPDTAPASRAADKKSRNRCFSLRVSAVRMAEIYQEADRRLGRLLNQAGPQHGVFFFRDRTARLKPIELLNLVRRAEAHHVAQFLARMFGTCLVSFGHASSLRQQVSDYAD